MFILGFVVASAYAVGGPRLFRLILLVSTRWKS
jgi:hypothetical protein